MWIMLIKWWIRFKMKWLQRNTIIYCPHVCKWCSYRDSCDADAAFQVFWEGVKGKHGKN